MHPLIKFFLSGNKARKQIHIEPGGSLMKRKYKAVHFCTVRRRYYDIVRERNGECYEYCLKFTAGEYIIINTVERPIGMKIINVVIQVKRYKKEALMALLRFIVFETYMLKKKVLDGSLKYDENKRVMISLLRQSCYSVIEFPGHYFFTLFTYDVPDTPFGNTFLESGVRDLKRARVDYCLLDDGGAWGFISVMSNRLNYNVTAYRYRIKADCGYVRVKVFRNRKLKTLKVAAPEIKTNNPVLFQKLLLKIAFDAVYGCIPGGIKALECVTDNCMAALVKPAFDFLEGQHIDRGREQYFGVSFIE